MLSVACLFLFLYRSPLCKSTSLQTFFICCLFNLFPHFEYVGYEHSCICLLVDIHIHFPWVFIQAYKCWVMWLAYVSLSQMENYFSQVVKPIYISLRKYESSTSSTPSSELEGSHVLSIVIELVVYCYHSIASSYYY